MQTLYPLPYGLEILWGCWDQTCPPWVHIRIKVGQCELFLLWELLLWNGWLMISSDMNMDPLTFSSRLTLSLMRGSLSLSEKEVSTTTTTLFSSSVPNSSLLPPFSHARRSIQLVRTPSTFPWNSLCFRGAIWICTVSVPFNLKNNKQVNKLTSVVVCVYL